ncbi:MAG: VCBS repeat-containing protein [Gemmataceae bacterium]|nr:VCBS repeat-containing protein [Gemmataceae bacterium]MDW8266093.1 VCBS repeat-containing protein [Gemmataceae bacterium]
MRFASPVLLLLGPLGAFAAEPAPIHWKKTVIDRAFRSEGVAIADVNRDGKTDILVGDVWYEAPTWRVHRIRPGKDDYRQGDANVYSRCFNCWADDINADGWPDLIVVSFPGEACHWYENPRGQPGDWKQHEIWHSACNETPLYADLFGTGRRVLVMGWQPKGKLREGQMAWFAPGPDPTQPWQMHPISEPSRPGQPVPGTFRYDHGLGIGDLNGDGRNDVIVTAGWWEQPARDEGKPWTFHPANLGEPCADMFTYDLDGDGLADVISSSAHNYGIWWHQQRRSPAGQVTFVKHTLFPKLFSQSHALHCVDINGDGLKDLVTGKRWWAHGPKGDVAPNDPAVLYWFEATKGSDGMVRFVPHLIDDDSGIGTQFVVADFNGDRLPDVVISNKKGVFVFEQRRGP